MGSNNVTDSHLAKVADGGPVGIADNFLQLASHDHEVEVSDSRLTFFSQTQWMGDCLSAGITSIAFDVNNISSL